MLSKSGSPPFDQVSKGVVRYVFIEPSTLSLTLNQDSKRSGSRGESATILCQQRSRTTSSLGSVRRGGGSGSGRGSFACAGLGGRSRTRGGASSLGVGGSRGTCGLARAAAGRFGDTIT
jgi:hypothetical protein